MISSVVGRVDFLFDFANHLYLVFNSQRGEIVIAMKALPIWA